MSRIIDFPFNSQPIVSVSGYRFRKVFWWDLIRHWLGTSCSKFGGQTKVYAVDVLNESECKKSIDDFIALPGEMDTIYANAGVGSPDGLSSGSAEKMNHVLSVNILGVTNTIMPFLPHLKEKRKAARGHV